MKKVILASVLAISAVSAHSAQTQVFCNGAGTATAVSLHPTDTQANYVKSSFTPKCSSTTHVTGEDGGSYYRVGSGSTKGKTAYAGTSAGGAVVSAGACAAPTGCAISDATTAMTNTTYAPTS